MDRKEFWEEYERTGLTRKLSAALDADGELRKEFETELRMQRALPELRDYAAPAGLWEKVSPDAGERRGAGAKRTGQTGAVRRFFDRIIPAHGLVPARAATVVAAVLLAVAGTLGVKYYGAVQSARLARQQADAYKEILAREAEFIDAINRLTFELNEKKDSLDPEMVSAYGQQLSVLDEFILICRDAVEENRYNAHARHYLIRAYDEKVKTLKEILEYAA